MNKMAFAAALLLLTGCTYRMLDFTVVSSKNVDLSHASEFKRMPQRVKGVDKAYIILFIPTGQPDATNALDKAIDSVPGAVALADGAITETFWWIPYIYGESSVEVRGVPLVDPHLPPPRTK